MLDDESGAPSSFSFTRQRSRQRAIGSINSAQVEIDIPTESRTDPDEARNVVDIDDDDEDDVHIPIEPLKTFLAALFMVNVMESNYQSQNNHIFCLFLRYLDGLQPPLALL